MAHCTFVRLSIQVIACR